MTEPTPTFAALVRRRPAMYLGIRSASALYLLILGWIESQILKRTVCSLEWIHEPGGGDEIRIAGPTFADLASSEPERRALLQELAGPYVSRPIWFQIANACSASLELAVTSEKESWRVNFTRGEMNGPGWIRAPAAAPPAAGAHAILRFQPDPEVLTDLSIRPGVIADRLAEIAARHPRTSCSFEDRSGEASYSFLYANGWVDYVADRLPPLTGLHPPIVISEQRDGIRVDAVVRWTDSPCSALQSWVNGQHAHAGSHLTGFDEGLWKAVSTYAHSIGLAFFDWRPAADRIGLIAAIDVWMDEEPRWAGSLKGELESDRAQAVVHQLVESSLSRFFARNPKEGRRIVERLLDNHWSFFRY